MTRHFAVVFGTRLTLRNPAYAGRRPAFTEADLGARYYLDGRALRGTFAGLYAGYEREDKFRFQQMGTQVPMAFVGATVGHDFTIRRFIIAPALAAEWGRQTPLGGGRSFELHPRIGIGFTSE